MAMPGVLRSTHTSGYQSREAPPWFEGAAARILALQGFDIRRVGLVPFPGAEGYALGIVTTRADQVDAIRNAAFAVGREMNFGPILVYGPGKQYRWPAFIDGSVRER